MALWTTGVLVSDRVIATNGRPSGFDYMRLLLAISVILFHTVVTSYGNNAQTALIQSNFGVVLLLILPMFFALSGFLVAGSLERSKSIAVFLGLRIFRIFPALVVDTLFCALVLGVIFTTLDLYDYFTHPQFSAYLLNMAGIIHFNLPGVFESNPSHSVNGQLWTIPIELECYIVLTLLGLIGSHRRRWLMLAITGFLLLALEARVLLEISAPWSGRVLLLCFLCGVLFFLYRDRIRLSLPLFLFALLASCICLSNPKLHYLAPIPVTYITVFLGLLNPRKSRFLESGDYSYGLFLYGFPLQQALVAAVPLAREWYWNAALAIPLALVFSVLSWHLVEKRVLARKHILFQAHEKWQSISAKMLKAVYQR